MDIDYCSLVFPSYYSNKIIKLWCFSRHIPCKNIKKQIDGTKLVIITTNFTDKKIHLQDGVYAYI